MSRSALTSSTNSNSTTSIQVPGPAGNTVEISRVKPALVPDAVDPSIVSITPDVPGTYSAQLVVTDDLGAVSAPATANVFTNLAPVAVAGADQAVDLGATVALDGSASYDPDAADFGDTIQSWTWVVTAPDSTSIRTPCNFGRRVARRR